MKTTLQARLDRTGKRVLCGKLDCGCVLVSIVTIPGAVLSDSGAPLVSGSETRYVQFGPGWQQGDHGLWSLTQRARQRRKRDAYLASGNGLVSARQAEAAQARITNDQALAYRRPVRNSVTGGLNQARHGIELPALARCPRCTGIVRIEAAALKAVSLSDAQTS